MPKLSLTKVAFGCRTIDALQKRVAARSSGGQMRVVTRMRPKRSDELIGGSIYWIVKHRLVGRQEILGFADRGDGRIDIVLSAELELIAPYAKRAHQGWRYLEAADAPASNGDDSGLSELPPLLYTRLAALALV
ncbi:MAG: DUF1489 family protein [Sphingomicrobium sp.]